MTTTLTPIPLAIDVQFFAANVVAAVAALEANRIQSLATELEISGHFVPLTVKPAELELIIETLLADPYARVKWTNAADAAPPTPSARTTTGKAADMVGQTAALVLTVLETFTTRQKIAGEDRLEDLGIDSLDRVQLSIDLEQRLGITVDDDAAGKWETVADVVAYAQGCTVQGLA